MQFPFEHTLYAAKELRDLCSHGGFGDIRIYGGFDCIPYDHQAGRLVLIGKKGN